MTRRSTLIQLLEAKPAKVKKALQVLETIRDSDITPQAAHFRIALLNAAKALEKGAAPTQVITMLRDAAKGKIDDLDDIEIDFDVPDTLPSNPFDGIMLGAPRTSVDIPGPDTALINAMNARDALTARRIAGDTIGQDDIAKFEAELVELAKALLPLLRLHYDNLDTL